MLLETVDRAPFVVIDGLDECDRLSCNDLLGLLRPSSQKISGLKTIMSSRPQEEILDQLDDTIKVELRADAQRVSECQSSCRQQTLSLSARECYMDENNN